TNQRIDILEQKLSIRIDETNQRIDRLYDSFLPKEKYFELRFDITALQKEVELIKQKIAV
ncbi:MAG: hypothetical protein AB1765_07725, partial [Candidatus Hydrogenedentota bacterium]